MKRLMSLIHFKAKSRTGNRVACHTSSTRWKSINLLIGGFFCISQLCFAQANETDPPEDTVVTKIKKYKPKISGFIQFGFLQNFDSNNDQQTNPSRFRVHRVRVKVGGKISKDISYQVEIDPRAPRVTGFLRDAYISLNYIPKHDILIGQQKTQFGYENTVSSSNLYFVNRTENADALSRGINLRDIGIGLIGSIKLNDRWRIEDAVTLVNGAGMNVQNDNNDKKSIWGRVGVRYKTDNVKWKFGVSSAKADRQEIDVDSLGMPIDWFINFTRLGVDIQYENKWFTFVTEYILGNNDEPEDPLYSETRATSAVAGYYVMAAGKTPFDAGPTLRFEDFDGEFQRWTIGAYYGEPSARLRILANYEIRKEVGNTTEELLRDDSRFYLWLMVRF